MTIRILCGCNTTYSLVGQQSFLSLTQKKQRVFLITQKLAKTHEHRKCLLAPESCLKSI